MVDAPRPWPRPGQPVDQATMQPAPAGQYEAQSRGWLDVFKAFVNALEPDPLIEEENMPPVRQQPSTPRPAAPQGQGGRREDGPLRAPQSLPVMTFQQALGVPVMSKRERDKLRDHAVRELIGSYVMVDIKAMQRWRAEQRFAPVPDSALAFKQGDRLLVHEVEASNMEGVMLSCSVNGNTKLAARVRVPAQLALPWERPKHFVNDVGESDKGRRLRTRR